MNFVTDVKRVWPGPGRDGLVLLQVGVSVPVDDVTEACIPVSSVTCIFVRVTLPSHDLRNDYPLAVERVTVNTVEKLIPHLRNKK